MVVFTETDTEDDRGSAGLIIFRTIAKWWDSHSHKQHTKLRTEDNGGNTRGCPSVLNCIAMTPQEKGMFDIIVSFFLHLYFTK